MRIDFFGIPAQCVCTSIVAADSGASAMAIAGSVCAVYWLMMLVGRLVGGAIGGVVTRPDMRRMGAVRESLDVLFEYMHEEGIPFSTLLPFDVPFYRMFGYEGIYRICNISMPVRSLSRYRCDIRRSRAQSDQNDRNEDLIGNALGHFSGNYRIKQNKQQNDRSNIKMNGRFQVTTSLSHDKYSFYI